MAIDRNDIEIAKWFINEAITSPSIGALPPTQPWQQRAIGLEDLYRIKAFIEAVEEHVQRPTEDVKSREWRAAVYKKLLEDPEALNQFTHQAIEKFGIENLSRMVVPEVQRIIVDQHLSRMTPEVLANILCEYDQLESLFEHLIEADPEFIWQYFGEAPEGEERINRAYDRGFDAGAEEGYNQGFDEGKQEGQQEGAEESYNRGFENGWSEGYTAGVDEGSTG
jgi:hypothetical protein